MKIGALSLLHRHSSRRTVTLAAWHNPKSLTWRWLLHGQVGSIALKPDAAISRRTWSDNKIVGIRAGIGGLIGFSAYKNNYGWQWTASLLFLHLSFVQQHSMWIKDLTPEPDERPRHPFVYQSNESRPEGASLH